MKGFIVEFKEFIAKGNVMDLAVGVIIGGAFKTIVDSLVKDMLMPVIGALTGGVDLAALSVQIRDAKISYGLFINAVINFLMIALVIFVMVKLLNKAKKLGERNKEPEEVLLVEDPVEIQLLREIRDSLKEKA